MKRIACVLLLVCLAITGCSKKEKSVAVVGGVKITEAEVVRVLKRKMKLLGQERATDNDRRETVEALVDRKLLYLEGVRLGLSPDEKTLQGEMGESRRKFADDAAFRAALREEGLDLEGFRKELEEGLVVGMVEQRLAAVAPPDETTAKAYYDGHRADFAVPPKYRVYLVQAGADDEARRLLDKYRNKPSEFDRCALKEMPQDLRRINQAAVLTPRDDFPEEMYPFLDRMKMGEIGGPVKARRGHFLFRLLDKVEGEQRPWELVKRDVTHMLMQEQRQNAVNKWLAEQRRKSKVEIP